MFGDLYNLTLIYHFKGRCSHVPPSHPICIPSAPQRPPRPPSISCLELTILLMFLAYVCAVLAWGLLWVLLKSYLPFKTECKRNHNMKAVLIPPMRTDHLFFIVLVSLTTLVHNFPVSQPYRHLGVWFFF